MNPLKAAKGLHARKQNLPAEKYGGYNSLSVSFFLTVKYTAGKKSEIIIMPVQTICGEQVMKSEEAAILYATSRLEQILGKPVTNVSLPLGLRKIKINTVLELDGYRACISGSAGKGRTLIMSSMIPFAADLETQNYVKRLESYAEKVRNNKNHVYDEKYDKVNAANNIKLYDLYLHKLQEGLFKKKINNVYDLLYEGKETFTKLTVNEQTQVLLNIQELFGRKTIGTDLTLIKGSSNTGATKNFSTKISNWKYKHAYIVDQSITGLIEKKSIDLFELL